MTNNSKNSKRIAQIYDKIFKRILTLSGKSVIGFINGLFGTDYPDDSTIVYNWTEHVDDELHRTVADAIITINEKHAYHIEAQMYEDEAIELRMFDYGYRYALKAGHERDVLTFPEPRIIYLYEHENIPNVKTLMLDFGEQGRFQYQIPVFKLLEHEPEELSKKNMIILIPFMIMKLRKNIEKERTKENMEALRTLISDDILGVIKENQVAGNLTMADANRLRNLIHKLYNHLYAHYKEFIEGGLNDMMEDDLVLEMDIIEEKMKKEMEEALRENTEQVTEQVTARVSKESELKMIRKLYAKLQDVSQVAELMDIPAEEVEEMLR